MIHVMDTATIIITGSASSIISLLITIGYIKGRIDSLQSQIKTMQEQINLLINKMINGRK